MNHRKQEKLLIQGGQKLRGTIKTAGSKNAALPILFSTILSQEPSVIRNLPHLKDVSTSVSLLTHFGCGVHFLDNDVLKVDAGTITSTFADYELVKAMRASILMLGPMLGRFHEASISMPGGCTIGTRPINFHIDAMKALGAEVVQLAEGNLQFKAPSGLVGAQYRFPFVSVTGTENLLMAAVLASGTSCIENAAREPEVVDLCLFLQKMGAKIQGIGESTLFVEGVKSLRGVEHRIISDRIEAGSFLVAAACVGGDVRLEEINPEYIKEILNCLQETGVELEVGEDWVRIQSKKRLQAIDIKTGPFPEFPTDMQAQFAVLNSVAQGESLIEEQIFENRFQHCSELMRMGADIRIKGNKCRIKGVEKLSGCQVKASDLRASLSLVIAGMLAEGQTSITNIHHIDRGYERIEERLSKLGADLRRV